MTVLPAYVGPGAGFAFLGSFLSLLLSIAAGLASLLIWPLRAVRRVIMRPRGAVRKLIFLGFDGLDPAITERLMAEGKLPHFSRLKETGGYRRLRTTFPALSPVAWSTFATGVNPAKHNIFDFLSRDLRTYAPEISSARVTKKAVELRRKSEPFWKILGRHAVSSTILRVPVTFPPEKFDGRMLAAMCTPDLRGTQGTYAKFPESGGLLEGPEGESVEFRVKDGWLEIQDQRVPLKPGEYTEWVRLKFSAGRGIARFLWTSDGVYVTPLQIDPERPALPISHPPYYAAWLSKALGTFSTLGMAEDTTALNEGAIDRHGFLEQARLIQKEREAMFFATLDRAQSGTVACVFDTTDRVQHMCFEDLDIVERLYCDMDWILGKTLQYVDQRTAIFVLSDHGFRSFRRGVNLNSWLRDEGYLALAGEPGKHLLGIDWSRTRAYTFGLGGVYLNLRGREALGIVEPREAAGLRREIADKLTGLRDEDTVAIERAWPADELYCGPYFDAAPDLIIGYADGYRASWDAANGIVSDAVFEDNKKAWCGDHCVDPRLVPGVLFSNRPLSVEDPGIEDMAPTALRLFGIEPPEWMEGSSVCA
ncbi:MAG TPA: alkaline phosphatase family protein [Bryobacteraceae bacterium]|nr:alkaline phosphatase family protein [Bryobacteraceae bacterium]